jgi:hypothetical protein
MVAVPTIRPNATTIATMIIKARAYRAPGIIGRLPVVLELERDRQLLELA